MSRAGKASLVLVLSCLSAIVLIGALVLMQGNDSPSGAASSFMMGLAKGDVDAIVKASVLGDDPPDVARKKWEQTVHRGEFYRFTWRITGTFTPTEEEAVVAMEVYKNIGFPTATEIKIQVPVTKIEGRWYVDAKGLTRDFYPGLPR